MECKMPRQFLNKMKLREKAIGRDRRENFAKEILRMQLQSAVIADAVES